MQNAVGVNIKGHFNLRQSARRRRNPFEVEFTQKLVRSRHLVFTLVDLNGHGRLIVFRGRKHLRVLGRNRGVALNHRGHHAAQRFNTKRQRRHIKKQYVVTVTGQNRALNCSADSHCFIGVHVLTGFLTEELAHHFLHAGHTAHATHKNHVGNIRGAGLGISQSLLHRFNRALNEVFDEAFKLRTRHRNVHVLRTGGICRDVGQVHFRFLTAREFNLGLFRGVL